MKLYNHKYTLTVLTEGARWICHYCGAMAESLDHVQPLTHHEVMMTDPDIDFIKVPSCLDCNSLLNDAYTETFSDRVTVLKIRAKQRLNRNPERYKLVRWSRSEINELERGLRGRVMALLNRARTNYSQRHFNIFTWTPDGETLQIYPVDDQDAPEQPRLN